MKSNKKKNTKRRPTQRNKRQRIPRESVLIRTPGQNMIVKPMGIPDTTLGNFTYNEIPAYRFNTAVATDSLYYNINSLAIVRVGGAAALVPFWDEVARSYYRYLVLSSVIIVKVRNRELVNDVTVTVFPSTNNDAVVTAADYSRVSSLPGAKTAMLQAATGGQSCHTFRLKMTLARMVGSQYLQQDQYAGVSALGSGASCKDITPTTLLRWGISFYNPNDNTLTTGGITCQVTLIQRALLTEPMRDLGSDAVMRDPNDPNAKLIRQSSTVLKEQINMLTTQLNLLTQ